MVLDHEAALRIALGRLSEPGMSRARSVERVLVLDVVGHIEGVALSELLATQGHEVSLAMPMAQPLLLDPESVPVALGRARRAGVEFLPFTLVPSISSSDGVMVVDALARRPEMRTDLDTVVIRAHAEVRSVPGRSPSRPRATRCTSSATPSRHAPSIGRSSTDTAWVPGCRVPLR